MKVFLSKNGTDAKEINISRKDLALIGRKDLINVNGKSYIVKNKALFFDKNNKLDYIVLIVERI